MSALAEALVAAQRRAVAVLEKAYVAGQIDAEDLVTTLSDIGAGDTVDVTRLLATLEVIRIHGAQAPGETKPAANGAPEAKASPTRGERRYRRRVASPKQWQAIIAAKQGPCRVCVQPWANGAPTVERASLLGLGSALIQLHHLVPRSWGGDDVPDNIAPLCPQCHEEVGRRNPDALRLLAESLTDAEYAYLIGKLGEGALERLYGVGR